MKRLTIICLIALSPVFCLASQKAITEIGDEVILYDDGTWKYLNRDAEMDKSISTNHTPLSRGKNLTFLLKSKKNNFGLWMDPQKWSFKKAVSNKAAEYELRLKGKDLYGIIITEMAVIPVESLIEIALENARKNIPDIVSTLKEYRIVNGNKVILMQMQGTYKGIKLVYYSIYFSDKNGSTQIVTYTSQGLFEELRKEAVDFLSGFVIN